MVTKDILRKDFLLKKKLFLEKSKKEDLDAQIVENLVKILPDSASETWGAYKSLSSEADPFESTLKTQFHWAYPCIDGDILKYYIPTKDQWIKNHHNIEEPNPKSSEYIELKNLSGVLVPAVAFDRYGYRLGWGKAFYDKTLKGFQGQKIGIAYSVQLMDTPIPKDNHDIPVDIIVTEKEVIRIIERK